MLKLIAVLVFICESNALRTGKIIGGKLTLENSAPYIAEIQSFNGLKFVHKCGGSIVHSKFLITAAHCIEGLKPKNVRILVGTNNVENGNKFETADKFVIHER